MKKNRTLLQQYRLLREASQLLTVAEKLKNTAHKSRRHDVLSDIIQKMGLKEQLKNEQIQ